MSKQPTPQRTIRPRVSSGVPWWIWLLVCLIGSGIAFSLIRKSFPEDPAVIFAEAMKASEDRDPKVFMAKREELNDYPDYEKHRKLLDAMRLLGSSRPLKAIPMLKEASEEKSIRSKALMFLGTAYAQAENPQMAISTFETVLSEDENDHAVRQNLASVFIDLFAMDDAIKQLNVLVEKDYKPSVIRKMRGDVNYELERFAEAAQDYEVSIEADSTDPTNSVKATRLVQCLAKLGDFEKAETYVGSVDQPGSQELLKVEKLYSEGKLDEVFASLDKIRQQAPSNVKANEILGLATLKLNSPEKTAVALALLRRTVTNETRQIVLYRILVDLALSAGDDELAGLAQQNVDLLEDLNKEFLKTRDEVIKTREGFDARMQLAQLAAATGRIETAARVYDSLLRSSRERESEIGPLKMQLYQMIPQLVVTGSFASEEAGGNPGREADTNATPPADAASPDAATPDAASPDAVSSPKAESSEPATGETSPGQPTAKEGAGDPAPKPDSEAEKQPEAESEPVPSSENSEK